MSKTSSHPLEKPTSSHRLLRWTATAVTLLFLGIFVLIPAFSVLSTAFREGAAIAWEHMSSRDTLAALALSLKLCLGALAISAVFGTAAAWLLARFRFPGRRLMLSLINLPLSLSPVIVGLLFILLYGKNAALGSLLESAGIRIIFSWPGLLLVTTFLSFPYVVRELIPVLEQQGISEEEAALTLGANGFAMFWRISLPKIRTALMYGLTLSAARALGEYGAASVVSGLLRGRTVTLPIQVQIYYAEYMTTAAYASALIFLAFAVVTLALKSALERSLKSPKEKL